MEEHLVLVDGIRKEIKDIGAERKEYYFKPPLILFCWIAPCIKDERDFPIFYMLFNVVVMTLPAAMFVFAWESHLLGFIYWIMNTALFQERFLIGLHYYSHRGLFKNKIMNTMVPLVVSPFFGMPSGMYYLHHVIMHHSENNLNQWDLSSTEPFQRDKITHFLFYWLRFVFAVWIELPLYAWKRSRYIETLSVVCFVFVYWVLMAILFLVNPCGTFWVFLFPLAFNSFLLMLGNWSQHLFVDPDNPRSNYHLTYNVINDECNQRSFNDGYHIEHHVNSKRHWSELPSNFKQSLATYAKEDAIVFENLNPIKVGIFVFLEKYNVLAKHLVQFRTPPRSPAEVETFLRSRLVPIAKHAKTK